MMAQRAGQAAEQVLLDDEKPGSSAHSHSEPTRPALGWLTTGVVPGLVEALDQPRA